jgi:hypothetical protein
MILPSGARLTGNHPKPNEAATASVPTMVFASGSAPCRWKSFCTPASGCATPHDEAWRSPPPCWLCAPPHAGRWPASGRPPSSRSSSTGWSVGSPPSCSASWESALSWPVSSLPPGRTPTHPFRGCFRQARRCRTHRGIVGDHHPAPNRPGDRQLNRALHTIVLDRMRQDSATKEYMQRRLAQGKTIRDIKRCL